MFQIVIPARYGSTRLPGKALLPILDKPHDCLGLGASHAG